ncbi:hypothetical protein DRE_00245 [Drechslerella stenobrocha 248]|uniref:F-box domain-containing protein n=1 Tax=Drechslerella stenobrocha 248 TaxID=1043628 RepID=W7II09_9PEZI|nr:hypothetical protein DRE_00245 [Drechslerella stenobrocha 248]
MEAAPHVTAAEKSLAPQAQAQATAPAAAEPALQWHNLPLEVAYLILDEVDWPCHSVCRQVCRTWRTYLDQPAQTAKRYDTPNFIYRVIRKTRGDDGTFIVTTVERPDIKVEAHREVHRMLAEPGLGFMLYVDPRTNKVKCHPGYFFAAANPSSSSRGGHRGTRHVQQNETDFRKCFPGLSDGKLQTTRSRGGFYDPDVDTGYRDSLGGGGGGGGGGGSGGVGSRSHSQLGPWCTRMSELPFAQELALRPSPDRFEVRFTTDSCSEKGDFSPRIHNWLNEAVKPGAEPLTVGKLLLGVQRLVMEEIQRVIQMNGNIFVRLGGIVNLPEAMREGAASVSLEVTVWDRCSWGSELLSGLQGNVPEWMAGLYGQKPKRRRRLKTA